MYNNFKIIKTKSVELYSAFVKKNHYTKTLARGCSDVFVLKIDNKIAGVAMYGVPTGHRVRSKYGDNTLELKRFCLSDSCLKNTASWFIAKTIKLLPKGTQIVSYADANVGHEGIIYRASNFTYVGKTKPTQYGKIIGSNKKIHLRNCYQKTNGSYTKTAINFQAKMKAGQASLKLSKPKHIYLYEVRK